METIFGILRFFVVLFQVILIFNLIIIVHEWGHFLAARWRGLKVEKFQIWFGKPIWKKTINGVQYGLGCIPAGGFVALPQMAPMGGVEGQSEEGAETLPPIKPLDKIIVAFAGPLFSILLAFAFGFLVWAIGYPDRGTKTTVIGYVQSGSAADGKLLVGDEILKIDGYEITSWDGMVNSVRERIIMGQGSEFEFVVRREGEEIPVKTGFDVEERGAFERSGHRSVGIGFAHDVVVGEVKQNSPAALAGMQVGDRVVSVNGEEYRSREAVSELIRSRPDEAAEIVVGRGGERLEFEVTPVVPAKPEGAGPMIGVGWKHPQDMAENLPKRPTPWEQVSTSATMMWRTISAITSSESSLGARDLSGPIGIGNLYYRLFTMPEGWKLVLWFSVLLNVNLAILNMLPFPILDGGHIVMGFFEMIFRRPINFRILEIVQIGCALLLFGFLLFVSFFDARDLGNGELPVEVEFAPPAGAPAVPGAEAP